jgi:hypothetical protein
MLGFERDYIYSMIRWMAIKVGDRRTILGVEGDLDSHTETFQEPTPFYHYDCDVPQIPVLVVTEEQEAALNKERRYWAVDEWGVRIGPLSVDAQFMSCLGGSSPNRDEFIEEIKALGKKPLAASGEEAQEAWDRLRREVSLKYLKPEIDANISIIRQEIQRLDKLWLEVA